MVGEDLKPSFRFKIGQHALSHKAYRPSSLAQFGSQHVRGKSTWRLLLLARATPCAILSRRSRGDTPVKAETFSGGAPTSSPRDGV